MSIDMSQFYQVFFEEAAEHLASMESLLLALDLEKPDPDQLNAIFRAAHSIKGASGTFGFTDMSDVTHELETLLDRLRKNELDITNEMVDVFLQAGDVLQGLLAAHQNGRVIDISGSVEVCAKLEKLSENSPPKGSNGMKDSDNKTPASSQPFIERRSEPRGQSLVPERVGDPVKQVCEIWFQNSEVSFPTENHLNNLLEELENIGTIENQVVTPESVSLTLTTFASDPELRDIFTFFLKPDQLTIKSTRVDVQEGDEQGYGFFEDVEAVKAKVEEEQGYGFFTDVDKVKEQVEDTQGYGFFTDVDKVKAQVEDTQGYGFFTDVDKVKSKVEDTQGYGFFTDPEAIKSKAEDAQGYGFFVDMEQRTLQKQLEAAPKQEVNPGMRKEDVPGRRATDAPGASAGDTSIRVNVAKVDQLVNLVGELVITQAMLFESAASMDQVLYERLSMGLTQLERNTRDLQDAVMSVRMMPINLVFSRFQRVVRDGAIKLGKRVQLKIVGEGTELDKGLIETISDPLNHLVRNSLDHGLETPEQRMAIGKDPIGTITLLAAHQGGNIVIQVSDDGGGLNREKILAKAREKGLPMNDNMSDAEVWQMIFAPGFSTAAAITDVSGRGVGMDVVKKNIESIGGRVDVASQFGLGSTITIRLPLTLAIVDGLSVAVGEQIYIIPLGFISESLQPKEGDIKEISGQGKVVQVRGEYLPLIAMHQLFRIPTKVVSPVEGILVLLESEGKQVALFVDELLGQHQVVIKSLETNYRKVPGVSGATIMGDGRVAMIVDVGGLVKMAQQ